MISSRLAVLPPSLHVMCRLRTDLRAETLSDAAGLTSHTTLLVFGESEFVGQDEAGHGRSTVGLTRARGTTIILGPPDLYGLAGLVQTTYAYYFTVHTSDWQLSDAPLPLTLGPQDLFAALRPLEATSWAEVPLALQIQNPEGRTVLLRLTLKQRKLPHPSFDPMSELPIYPRHRSRGQSLLLELLRLPHISHFWLVRHQSIWCLPPDLQHSTQD